MLAHYSFLVVIKYNAYKSSLRKEVKVLSGAPFRGLRTNNQFSFIVRLDNQYTLGNKRL